MNSDIPLIYDALVDVTVSSNKISHNELLEKLNYYKGLIDIHKDIEYVSDQEWGWAADKKNEREYYLNIKFSHKTSQFHTTFTYDRNLLLVLDEYCNFTLRWEAVVCRNGKSIFPYTHKGYPNMILGCFDGSHFGLFIRFLMSSAFNNDIYTYNSSRTEKLYKFIKNRIEESDKNYELLLEKYKNMQRQLIELQYQHSILIDINEKFKSQLYYQQ